ncbi:MAG: hypothetical protein P4L46_01855 [Fimbriimonas sp.]|nr:hypothetical protein [Fimbriimonas sp.]
MLIDWFTVCAQVINFLILVWLMKRSLYKPILSAIETREKKIATEIAAADAKKVDAQREHDEFQHKNEEFDKKRAALMTKAHGDAKAERERLLGEARTAADELTAKRKESLRAESIKINEALSSRARQEVFAVTRKALADLATTSLEERMGEVFTRRLLELDAKAKEAIGEALKTAGSPTVIRSAFDLPDQERTAIQNAVNETFSTSVDLRFEASPALISGIELSVNGQKVSWSIDDYLTSLEKDVDELLTAKKSPEPAKIAKPTKTAKLTKAAKNAKTAKAASK